MSNDMSNNKKKIIIPAILLLVIAAVGVTYAFFNYTRTGPANTLNTGRIYFSTEQTNQNTITLNNIFPMTKEQALADSSTNGTLVVTFNGDTTYTDGMEYLLSIDSVTGTTNVPISLIMDVNITENSVAVAENANYYTAREAKNTSMYISSGTDTTINSTTHKVITDIETGKYLLAGYIKSGEYGINGSITIKAFIDADNILITDTPDDQSQRPSTAYTDGTDTAGKTVISTDDWNALQSTGITFKVKGEAREGIWVEEITNNCTMDTSLIKVVQSFNSNNQKCRDYVTQIYSEYPDEIDYQISRLCVNYVRSNDEQYLISDIERELMSVSSKSSIEELEEDGVITNVVYDYPNKLLFGVEYVNDKFTYTYNNETWAVKISDRNSTEPIIKPNVCLSVNDMPVANMNAMFGGSQATQIDLSSLDTSYVTNMSWMFQGSKATSINLSGINTTNVTDMSGMFAGSQATSINLSGINTTNVTDMSRMFAQSKVSILDLSSFSTSANPKACEMFYANIRTIYVSNKWNNTNLLVDYQYCGSKSMFSDGIVGGNGTTYNSSNDDKTMAVIDTPSTPGYLTLKTN